jgi:amino acid permease
LSFAFSSFIMASGQGSDQRKLAYDADVISQAESSEVHTALIRKLKNRHVAMISIGGVIGTGLFFGIAPSLMNGGPLGLLLGYMFIATICLAMMVFSCPRSFQARIVLPLFTALPR